MIQSNLERFFYTARERYTILLNRRAGVPRERWTSDKIFQTWRFCNTFREDDKTTEWFRKNIRGFVQRRAEDAIRTCITFRWFNRIETSERIRAAGASLLIDWDSNRVREILKGVSPVVTGAYIIKTPNGMNKLDGVLWSIDQILPDVPHLAARLEPETTAEGFWEVLQTYPYLGGFMAYQIVSDLLHTVVLEGAPDRMLWAFPGPGCARGLGWLVANMPDRYSRTNKTDLKVMQCDMQQLLHYSTMEHFWPNDWPKWEMQSVQHWACEFDKYTRALNGQDQKRRFS